MARRYQGSQEPDNMRGWAEASRLPCEPTLGVQLLRWFNSGPLLWRVSIGFLTLLWLILTVQLLMGVK